VKSVQPVENEIIMPPGEIVVECGCDEAGRGAAAAEVYVAAVILNPDHTINGLADSKKLSARKRDILNEEIRLHALSWRIDKASVEEVERLNVLQATLLAMKRAVEGLSVRPGRVLVDGNRKPVLEIPVEAIVKGDAKIPAISAASILAKVARDRAMVQYHRLYPEYGFDIHKGYLTKKHIEAIRKHGPCPIHRRSFFGVMTLELPF
jgi:ribonuclease HII